ncbi:MAG: glycosyltransferase family 39 protein [Thermomicrobiales bacterium]
MVLSFGLAAWSSASIFDRLPRTEDEVTFLFQAKSIAAGEVIASAPEHPTFFFMSFVIARDGMWFGKYPPGFPAILALGEIIGQTWVINALAASVAVGLLVLVGRRLYDLRTALIGATLMALSPFFIIQSGALLSHVVALCWVLLLLLLVDLMRNRDMPLAALGAGIAAGMLLLTRPLTAVGIALPFVVLAVADLSRGRPLWGRYGLLAVGALPFVAILLVYNDTTTGHPLRSAYELWWEYDRIGFGPEYGINGHTLSDAMDNTRSNLRDLSVVLFGWPLRLSLLPVLAAAVVASVRVRRDGLSRGSSADLLLAGMVIGLIGIHMLYWTPGKMYGPRYYFEIIGALSLLAGRGSSGYGMWYRGALRDLKALEACSGTSFRRSSSAWSATTCSRHCHQRQTGIGAGMASNGMISRRFRMPAWRTRWSSLPDRTGRPMRRSFSKTRSTSTAT